MTESDIDALASQVAALTPEETQALERTVAGLRAERARVEEERIAWLRALTDEEAVDHALVKASGDEVQLDETEVLATLKDAGFVRGVTLEGAYRAGYVRGGYDASRGSRDISEEDDDDYLMLRHRDLTLLARKSP